MDVLNELVEHEAAPELPPEPAPQITSRFLFVDVAALRAKQLRRGARVRFREGEAPAAMHKAERVAMEEVRRGLVFYDIPGASVGGDGKSGSEGEAASGGPPSTRS
jgi:DNA-directed RNA polymerase subunit K/omega